MSPSDAAVRSAPESAQDIPGLLESSSVVGCVVLGKGGEIRRANGLFREWLRQAAGGTRAPRSFAELLPRSEDAKLFERSLRACR
jgi:hypothetical protein